VLKLPGGLGIASMFDRKVRVGVRARVRVRDRDRDRVRVRDGA
jgi:hypothetical protein